MNDQTAKPTKIIKPPKKTYVFGTLTLLVTTDAGVFSSKALAKLIGFDNHHGWTQRLKAKGWQHPDILKPPAPKGHFISGEPMKSGDPADFGTDEWRALGDTVRDHNLKKIPRACCEHLRGDECAMGCQ
jgi:hypothetical protein